MALINEIVNVVIRRDVIVPRPGFGIMMFLAEVDNFPEDASGQTNTRLRQYANAAGVEADFTDTGTPTTGEINFNTGIINMATQYFNQPDPPEKIYIGLLKTTDTVESALDAIVQEDNEWYAIASSSRVKTVQEEIAAWVSDNASTNKKIVGLASNDTAITTPGNQDNIAYNLVNVDADGSPRAFVMFHTQAYVDPGNDNANVAIDVWPEVTWLGLILPQDPGSVTWMFKQLQGVPIDNLTATASQAALETFANVYESVGGVAITREGTVLASSKDYIDITRGIDFLISELQVNVYTLLVNEPKVPYTNEGITAVESKVKETLSAAIDQGILADVPAPTTSVPDILDVDEVDKQNRVLNDVLFTATLAGAIHKVNIEGRISI